MGTAVINLFVASVLLVGCGQTPSDSSIVVAPFVDLTPAEETALLLQEEFPLAIAAALSDKSGVTAMFQTEPDEGSDADYQATGSVMRLQERVRVTIELMDSGSSSPVWSNVYEGPADEWPTSADRVAAEIVQAIGAASGAG